MLNIKILITFGFPTKLLNSPNYCNAQVWSKANIENNKYIYLGISLIFVKRGDTNK